MINGRQLRNFHVYTEGSYFSNSWILKRIYLTWIQN